VGARLDHARAVEYHDEVGHARGTESMRDEDGDPPIGHPGLRRTRGVTASRRRREPLEQRVLGLRVERRRGLVEHEEERAGRA